MKYREDPQWLVALINRDGPNCWYCGAQIARSADMILCDDGASYRAPDGMQSPTRDHLVPRSRRGSNRKHNLVLACAPCNVAKGARTLDEYRSVLEEKRHERVKFFGETA